MFKILMLLILLPLQSYAEDLDINTTQNNELMKMQQAVYECYYNYAVNFYNVNASPSEISIGAESNCASFIYAFKDFIYRDTTAAGLASDSALRVSENVTSNLKEVRNREIINTVIKMRSKKLKPKKSK